MPEYVLGHQLKGEEARLALMSELLDPMHRRYIDALGVVRPGARTLEVGCEMGKMGSYLNIQDLACLGQMFLAVHPSFLTPNALAHCSVVDPAEQGTDFAQGQVTTAPNQPHGHVACLPPMHTLPQK